MSAGETFDALIKMAAVNKAAASMGAQAPEVAIAMEAQEPEPPAEESKPKAKKPRKKAVKKAEKEEAADENFDPFEAEGVMPPVEDQPKEAPAEPAEPEPQEEPEVKEEAEVKEPAPEPEKATVTDPSDPKVGYVISEGDFANARYASKYAGKTLSDVSKAELKAVLSFGDKAITPAFAKVIEDYLKG
jgi:hypothetical protein